MASCSSVSSGLNRKNAAHDPIFGSPLSSWVTRREGYVMVLPSNTLLDTFSLDQVETLCRSLEIDSSLLFEPRVRQ